MILAVLLLLTGLTISAVAIYYSVAGLTAIFSAAVIPIIVMGSALEIGKLVCASWLKANWYRAPRFMKVYMTISVVVLMMITSMGIFGFLSRAHNDQNIVSGDVLSKIQMYDEKIKTAKENIEADRKQLKQMDEAVDQIMGRSSDEKGADKANAVRKSQQKDRVALARDIETNQKTISKLNDESAPIRAENRKVEAEVGPIKYIAAFIYGANPDSSLLERAVTWIIILIVIVFDPLAVIMLLASQMTFGWTRDDRIKRKQQEADTNIPTPTLSEPSYEADDGPLTDEQIEHIRESAKNFLPTGEVISQEQLFEDIDSAYRQAAVDVGMCDIPDEVCADELATEKETDFGDCPKCETPLINASGIGPFCPNKSCDVMDGPFLEDGEEIVFTYVPEDDSSPEELPLLYEDDPLTAEQQEQITRSLELLYQGIVVDPIDSMPLSDDTGEAVIETAQIEFDFSQEANEDQHIGFIEDAVPQFRIVTAEEDIVPEPSIVEGETDIEDIEPFGNELQQHAMRIWRINNPTESFKKYIDLDNEGKLEYLPWNHPDHLEKLQLSDRELIEFQATLEADNEAISGEVKGFGINFPSNPNKGDMFLRVDSWPSQLHKYNGKRWIQVNKNLSDGYVYDDAYIEHLIEKIGAGEYDPELLSEAEKERIAYQLNIITDTE